MESTDTALLAWDVAVGFVSANVILPLIQQPQWSKRVRSVTTFVYSLVVGLGIVWFQGGFDGVHDRRDVVIACGGLLVVSVSVYKGFAKDFGLAPVIERATTFSLPARKPESRHHRV